MNFTGIFIVEDQLFIVKNDLNFYEALVHIRKKDKIIENVIK